MISLRPTVLAAAALAVLLSDSALGAESMSGAPVEVKVTPRTPLVGQPVTISGTTGFEQRANSVTIVVRKPGGKQSKPATATVNAQGAFTFQFADTKSAGQYAVEVTGPKGKSKGSAQFQVVNLPGLADQLDAAFRAIDKRADQLTGTAKQSAQSLPASPERDEFLKKMVAIESRAQTVNLPPVAIIGQLRRVVQGPQVVYLPDQVVIGKLQQSLEGMQDAVDQIDRAGVIGRRSDSICETINTAIEGAKFAGVAFNVAQTALATLQAVFTDKAIGSYVQQSMGEGADALAVSSGLKTAAAGLTVELGALKSLPGLVLDFIEYGSKQVFNAHCVRIQGPMRVRMLMTWNEGVQPWLRYGVRLEGRLTLRYEKQAAAGGAQPVTGEFEGSATRFTFWENIFVVEPLPRGITPLGRHWLAPPGIPAAVEWPVDFGSILRSVTPYSFNIPVTGALSGAQLQMRIEPARVDFTSLVHNRLLLVVFNGLTPDFRTFSFPIEKAQWIVLKGFGDSPQLPVQKDEDGNRYIVENRRHHRETAGKGVVVDWDIRLDTRLKSLAQLPAPPFSQ